MSKNDFHKKLQSAREAGLVSIMVTLILMIVISLIVLGFAQISRRNQRQALDRQLSTQAFYAAETGVNDARDLINAAVLAGSTIPAKSDCGTGSGIYTALNPDLDGSASEDAEYTCVMVDPTPDTLLYGDVSTQSTIVPVISESGVNLSRITIAWETKDATSTPTMSCPTTITNVFSATGSSWQCGYGVLRLDLVPTSGNFNYAGLQSSTMTTFLVPFGVGGDTEEPYVAGGGNNAIGVDCTDINCTFSVTGLSTDQYYMRISSLYKNVWMRINAYDSSGGLLSLRDAQAVIDATGKAQDVLRRIQVHVPLTASSQNLLSDYVMRSTDAICKRFVVMDNYFDSQVTGVTSTNPLCQDVP